MENSCNVDRYIYTAWQIWAMSFRALIDIFIGIDWVAAKTWCRSVHTEFDYWQAISIRQSMLSSGLTLIISRTDLMKWH